MNNECTGQGKRRIPTGDYMQNKKINYLLYAYLQKISYWHIGNDYRYVNWKMVNKTEVMRELKITRRNTFYNRLNKLEEFGFIEFDGDMLKLPNIGDYYELVDLSLRFFKLLLNNTKDHTWKTYLVHLGESRRVRERYGKNEYYITREAIAERIGYSKTHLDVIQDANEFLKEIGVLDYRVEQVVTEEGIKNVNVYRTIEKK